MKGPFNGQIGSIMKQGGRLPIYIFETKCSYSQGFSTVHDKDNMKGE